MQIKITPTTAHTEQTKTIMQISAILTTRNIRIADRVPAKSKYEVNLWAGLTDKHQLTRMQKRERLLHLSEKELLVELILQLEKVNRKCDDIRRKIVIWSN